MSLWLLFIIVYDCLYGYEYNLMWIFPFFKDIVKFVKRLDNLFVFFEEYLKSVGEYLFNSILPTLRVRFPDL